MLVTLAARDKALGQGGTAEADQRAPAPAASTDVSAAARKEGDPIEAGARKIQGTAAGLAPPGGVYGLDSAAEYAREVPGAQPATAELHVVKQGDTLWSLCASYFNDPWRWPRLWALNPLITNPHWIFPGDVIRLRPAGAPPEAAGSGGGALPPGEAGESLVTVTRQKEFSDIGLVLREIGYVEARDIAASAVISGSREEKILLSTGDQVYLSFAKDRPLRAGERYTIFVADTKNPVRSPETGAVLGYLVRIHGDVVIDQIADRHTARGTLIDLVDPVERGQLVSPFMRRFKELQTRPSAVNLEARIIAAFVPTRMQGPYNFVVLSRGRRHGVQVGNRTFVIRRGDGYRRILEDWDKFDPRYPKEVVGELLVVDALAETSVAWVSRSNKELRVGEITEMRKGY